ncbi:MAG: glycosyltransferase family protein [Magnetococcales bacterium]|nr:glycosyltransferase family protein [Magnetococcales bacterium]
MPIPNGSSAHSRTPMNLQHVLALKTALDHLQANRPLQALEIARNILEHNPDHADAWFLSGVASDAANQPDLALEHLNRACQMVPDSWEYLNHRALVLYHLGRFDASRADYEQSLHHKPDNPEALANLARIHMLNHRPDLALPCFHRALAQEPDNATLLGDLGVCLVALKHPREGIACYRAGLALAPGDAEIHYNLSRALLMVGDYREGWLENEWRWQTRHYQSVSKIFPHPLWQGESLQGRRILLLQEQGFGDGIQMIRYAALLAGMGGTVLVVCDQPLLRLFATMPAVQGVALFDDPPPTADYCCPMMSLPKLCDTRLETIPSVVPYLFPLPNHHLPKVWEAHKRPVVGLIWRGKTRHQLTLNLLKPLLSVQTVSFLSLQKDARTEELTGLPILDTQSLLTDFAVTATLMVELDLIISIDSATAHLAGALGKPVWILVSHASEWRWLAEGIQAPWYPTAMLYRQTKPDSWCETIDKLATDLTAWAEQKFPPK